MTDAATRTSILVTNTSQLTLIVVPANALTTLQKTLRQDPNDPSDQLAFQAFQNEDLAGDPVIPNDVQASEIYFVPPGYSVCGTVPQLGDDASVKIERDQVASAAWFVDKYAADKTVSHFLPKDVGTIEMCANTAVSLATTTPDFSAPAIYHQALDLGSSCYNSYELLLTNAGEDTATAAKDVSNDLGRVLDDLDRAPKLIQDLEFITELAHR